MEFDPARSLGKWYEVARLPTRIQPPDTLAAAEYLPGDKKGEVMSTNPAYDRTGRKISDTRGRAKLVEGDPTGRLLVAFGPVLPEKPNCHVLYVDNEYRFAVVGVPDRKWGWILAQEVPLDLEKLVSLKAVAEKAGFDVSELRVVPWDQIPRQSLGQQDGAGQAVPAPERLD